VLKLHFTDKVGKRKKRTSFFLISRIFFSSGEEQFKIFNMIQKSERVEKYILEMWP
jgi:hypothetical protein